MLVAKNADKFYLFVFLTSIALLLSIIGVRITTAIREY